MRNELAKGVFANAEHLAVRNYDLAKWAVTQLLLAEHLSLGRRLQWLERLALRVESAVQVLRTATDETPPCVGEKMADVARDHFQATGEDHDD